MLKTDLRHYKKFLYRDDENNPVLLSYYASISDTETSRFVFYTWRNDIVRAVKDFGKFEKYSQSDAYGKEWDYETLYWGKLHTFIFESKYLQDFLKFGYFERGQFTSPKEIDYPTFYFPTSKSKYIFAWNIEDILGRRLKANGLTFSEIWQIRRENEQKNQKESNEQTALRLIENAKYIGLLDLQFELEDFLNEPILPFIRIDKGMMQDYYESKLLKYPDNEQVNFCRTLLKKFLNQL